MRDFDSLDKSQSKDLVMEMLAKKLGESDMDWADMVEKYSLDLSPDTIRKGAVGVKLAMDAGCLDIYDKPVPEPQPPDGYQRFAERQKLRDTASVAAKLFREQSRSELLRETLAEAIGRLPEIKAELLPLYESGEKSLALAIGDFHYGADITVRGLFGEPLNVYNSRVFEERMDNLLGQTANILAREQLSDVSLFIVGDMLDGMLRQTQLSRLEFGAVDGAMRLAEYLSKWIAELSRGARVRVHCVTGNHGETRPLGSKKGEFEDENLERVVIWYAESRLEGNARVSFPQKPDKMLLTGVQGFQFLLFHGDNGRAVGDIAKESVNLYGVPIDFFICGHRHSEAETPFGVTGDGNSVVVRVPSVCGMDKYAQSKGYGGRPGATAMVIEKGYGRRCVYPIRL